MVMALAVVLGSAGVILVLVGLIGGGFTFSGSVMPVVGKVARLGSFGVGGVLIFVAMIVMAVDKTTPAEAAPTTPSESTDPSGSSAPDGPAPDRAPATFAATVMVPPGYEAKLFADPNSALDPNALPDATLPNGAPVEIACTLQGPAVSSAINGQVSTLWDGTSTGYFIPDVDVFTNTDHPVMPSC
jgi:hypothetical protein